MFFKMQLMLGGKMWEMYKYSRKNINLWTHKKGFLPFENRKY
jgi:hypothetical protein